MDQYLNGYDKDSGNQHTHIIAKNTTKMMP